jgi:hypothetical protein
MTTASEISETLKIPFKKIRFLINNPALIPTTELSEYEIKVITRYVLRKQKKFEAGLKKKVKAKPKYPKVKGLPNPLNPNEYKYPRTIIISTPMGGKTKK